MTAVEYAMQEIKRRDFLPAHMRVLAGQDMALPIGHQQTNSQPSTVRQMLDWIDVQPAQCILDVGSGSGWTSALLAKLVGAAGVVHAVERIPELVELGRSNCRR